MIITNHSATGLRARQEKGVSLIITFFILTIILAIVISISTLLYSQIKIIRNIGNSVVAFYAADSGVEKTLYYDRKWIPVGGTRGLCDIGNICPNCTPGVDCTEFECQGYQHIVLDAGTGCDPLICNNCEISFNSFFDDKSYNVKISTTSDGELSATSIDSKGNYKDVSRKIQLTIGNVAVTPPPPTLLVSVFASPNPANINQTVTFFATPSGGTGSYSYSWIGDCIGTSQNCITSFAESGGKVATVTVTSGNQTASDFASVVINPEIISPFITTQPANQTVNIGQTALFSVSASGTEPLTYQWQKNGINISGATFASYTTPPAVIEDNNAIFRVIVTNSAGSTTSNDAILTVIPTITAVPGIAGNWTEGSAWVGGVAPTAFYNCLITSATTSITINSGAVCRSVDFTGFAGTVTHNATATLTIGDGTAGAGNIALKFVPGMTYNLGSATTSAISFVSTSTMVQTVDFAGKTTGDVTYNGVGGSWQMTGTHNTGVAATLTLTNGTLNTNGHALTIGRFSSSNTNVRTLTMGSSTLTLIGTGTVWNTGNSTNFTFNSNTSLIRVTNTATGAITFAGGGRTFNNVWFSRGASTGGITITGANTFNDFRDDGTAAHTIVFPNVTTTVTSFSVSGNSGQLITLARTGTSGTFTLTKVGGGTICRNFLSISNSASTPVATWYAGANSTNGGGNTGWTFTACP